MYVPYCDVFAVGSYPYKDPLKASRRILSNHEMLLHWPQLPKRSKSEEQIAQTYLALATPNDDFRKGTASGWNAMWRLMKKLPLTRQKLRTDTHFKTQIAGPITLFGKSQGKRTPDQTLLPLITLWLRHAYWQIDQIKEQGYKPLVVLDEPLLPNYMGAPGSAVAKKTLRLLKSIVVRLRKRGALVGIHCCNRVSPALLIDLGVDLVHFDAYYFPTQISRTREKLQRFLVDGGIVAWGIVPTSESLTATAKARLEKNFTDLIMAMETRGLPLRAVLAQSMVAPTCGTGLLSIEQSERIIEFASMLSKQMKSRYRLKG